MDCVVGKPGTSACLLVLTERVSRQELIFKMKQIGEDNQAVTGTVEIAALHNMQFGTRTYEAQYFPALTEFS